MENKISFDTGEEIIQKLKEINRILEKIINNEEKLQNASEIGK